MRPVTKSWRFRIFTAPFDVITAEFKNRKALNFNIEKNKTPKQKPYKKSPNPNPSSNHNLQKINCKLFSPAATKNQITSHNVHKIKCKILVEGANGPTTAAADDILESKGVFVIPDFLANAGGATCSYLEWVLERMGNLWRDDRVSSPVTDS